MNTSARPTIEWRPIDTLRANPRNARTHSPEQLKRIGESITEHGFLAPVVITGDGELIAGHGRVLASQSIGMAEVPCVVADHLSEQQVRTFMLADNSLTIAGGWDEEALSRELSELRIMGADLDMLGMPVGELDRLLGTLHDDEDVDAVPEPPDAAVTRKGDVWTLGDHRLMCGDSSSPEDVDRLLAGAPVHLVNTDPPYNVKVEPRSNNAIAAGLSSFTHMHHQGLDLARHPEKSQPTGKMRAKDRPLENDFVSDEEFDRLLAAWFGNMARVLLPGRSFYVWGGYANCGNYPPVLKACDLYFSQAVIWVKGHPVLTRKDFMGNHEWCFYGWRLGAGHEFFGPNNVYDVWEVKKVNPQSMVHLTEKPVELAVRAIQYSSRPGENVLDLFGGSGSTLIACEQTGRHGYLMEIDELYCDVIITRWQNLTGKTATLDGKPYSEVAESRKTEG